MKIFKLNHGAAFLAGVSVSIIIFFFCNSGRLAQFIDPRHSLYNRVFPKSQQQLGFAADVKEDKSLEDTARAIYAKRGVVAFAVINNAYLPMALSWCCNTAGMAGVHESVLFLTTDTPSALRLRALFPALTVVSLNTSHYDGAQEYARKGYVRIMVQRTRVMLRLLEAGVRLLLFEVDCLWLSDPVPALLARRLSDDVDVIATVVSQTGGQAAGGFLLLSPSAATLKLWSALTQRMVQLYDNHLNNTTDSASISEALNDQVFLINLIQKRYAGVKVFYLSPDLYPDGKWYASHKPGQPLKEPRPVIINNNWVIGNQKKTDRAKAYGHWFWDDKAGMCNATALNNLFH